MEAIYYAKSADESGNKTTNQEHLKSVAELAMRFGEALSMPRLAWTAGILHDFGKYSEAFQSVLNGTATNIDHAICSAAFLYGANMTSKHQNYCLVAAVTAAHHSTLRAFFCRKRTKSARTYAIFCGIPRTARHGGKIPPPWEHARFSTDFSAICPPTPHTALPAAHNPG